LFTVGFFPLPPPTLEYPLHQRKPILPTSIASARLNDRILKTSRLRWHPGFDAPPFAYHLQDRVTLFANDDLIDLVWCVFQFKQVRADNHLPEYHAVEGAFDFHNLNLCACHDLLEPLGIPSLAKRYDVRWRPLGPQRSNPNAVDPSWLGALRPILGPISTDGHFCKNESAKRLPILQE
jgi:hypothetical protein